MSILTKEDRGFIQGNLIDGLKMRRGEGQDQALATICENYLQDTLDTIDALERIIKGIERATSMQQVETVLIAARAFGVIEEGGE